MPWRILRMTRRCTCDRRSLGKDDLHKEQRQESAAALLYKENHSLYEWFKKAYGDE